MNTLRRLLPPISVLGLLALAACDVIPAPQSDPTRFYVLAGPAPAAQPSVPSTGLRIGLRSVDLAGYLRTPSLVVRRGPDELSLQDYARWAEPLDAGISRLLGDQIKDAPGVRRVFIQPFPLDADRDYDVTVTISRCEGAADSAQFAATFEIATVGADSRLVVRRSFVAPAASWDGRDFGRLVELLSADVQSLGRDIVSALPAPAPAN
jgi:uncharacterized lipoprotein YmbA